MSANVRSIAAPRAGNADRAELVAAIEAAAAARAAVSSAEDALERGRAVVASAQAELERATELVGKAKERDARSTAAGIRNRSGGASPDARATKTARAAVLECEDALEAAGGAVERLEQDGAEAEDRARWRENAVLVARNHLLAEVSRELLERAATARLTLAISQALLLELLNRDVPDAPKFPDDNVMDRIRAQEQRAAPLAQITAEAKTWWPQESRGEGQAAYNAVTAWRAAIAGLAKDADAELPPLP
jgi:hypothetical protein